MSPAHFLLALRYGLLVNSTVPVTLQVCLWAVRKPTTDSNSTFGTSLQAWIVLGVVTFGTVIVVSFTWIMFLRALHKNNREYGKFLQSLNRRRMNRERRNQAVSSSGHSHQPLAISYRRNANSSPEVYVSLAQLTALNRYQGRIRENNTQHPPGPPRPRPPGPTHVSAFEIDVFSPDDTPSAPPFPGSPPDYYEYMTQQEGQLNTSSPHDRQHLHLIEEQDSETEQQDPEGELIGQSPQAQLQSDTMS